MKQFISTAVGAAMINSKLSKVIMSVGNSTNLVRKPINLMSAEEYAKKNWPELHVFDIEKDDKILRFFGSKHSNNPDDLIFSEIRKQFNDFQPDAVFIEGV